tara:strand:+ start:197 stop:370 length:174 start_codon:yes stop_codon:yes gene_type:complete
LAALTIRKNAMFAIAVEKLELLLLQSISASSSMLMAFRNFGADQDNTCRRTALRAVK